MILKRAKLAAGAIVTILVLGGMVVLVLRIFQANALESATAVHARQYVNTIRPKAAGGGRPITLPGTLQGFIAATVYARSSG